MAQFWSGPPVQNTLKFHSNLVRREIFYEIVIRCSFKNDFIPFWIAVFSKVTSGSFSNPVKSSLHVKIVLAREVFAHLPFTLGSNHFSILFWILVSLKFQEIIIMISIQLDYSITSYKTTVLLAGFFKHPQKAKKF